MAIKAKSKGFDLKGIYLNIEKVMTQNKEEDKRTNNRYFYTKEHY